MEDQPARLNIRQILLILLILLLFGGLVYFGAASIRSQLSFANTVVVYYGRTVTMAELTKERGDNFGCAPIPFRLPAENLWHQFFRQPTFQCFKSMDEAYQWSISAAHASGG